MQKLLHKEVNGQDMRRRLSELVDSGGFGSDGLMTNQEVFQRPIARAAYQMHTHTHTATPRDSNSGESVRYISDNI